MGVVGSLRIDAAYPGGNILVLGRDKDAFLLRQDDFDSEGGWFYWNLRVRGGAGKKGAFRFLGGDVVGPLGPAVSTDSGKSWRWLGKASLLKEGGGFRAMLPKSGEIRFAACIPYVESHLHGRIGRFGPFGLSISELCRSEHGRPVELIHVGQTKA